MSGVEIVTTLLRADSEILQLAAAPNIKGGVLADDAPLNSILVRSISETERVKLSRPGWVRITERVEVMVRARSYREASALRVRSRDVCAGKTGDIGGGTGVSILNAGAGPELTGPGNSFQRAQDLSVSYVITV